MFLVSNKSQLSVQESEYIDGVFYLAYDEKQVSPFLNQHQAELLLRGSMKNMDEGMQWFMIERTYTHKMDLNSYADDFRIVTVDDQDYVFAYNIDGQVCDIFQYNNQDFVIDVSELNRSCETIYEGLNACIKKYNEHRHDSRKRKNAYQSI